MKGMSLCLFIEIFLESSFVFFPAQTISPFKTDFRGHREAIWARSPSTSVLFVRVNSCPGRDIAPPRLPTFYSETEEFVEPVILSLSWLSPDFHFTPSIPLFFAMRTPFFALDQSASLMVMCGGTSCRPYRSFFFFFSCPRFGLLK